MWKFIAGVKCISPGSMHELAQAKCFKQAWSSCWLIEASNGVYAMLSNALLQIAEALGASLLQRQADGRHTGALAVSSVASACLPATQPYKQHLTWGYGPVGQGLPRSSALRLLSRLICKIKATQHRVYP